MIIFWIFTLFVGSSAFAFAYIFLQVGVGWSLGYAVLAMLLTRGMLSIVRRSLIIRERITPETDVLQRTVETNRAIFWKRALYLALVPILYFLAAYELFGLPPEDAIAALPQFLQTRSWSICSSCSSRTPSCSSDRSTCSRASARR